MANRAAGPSEPSSTHGIRNELRIDDYPVGRYVVQAGSPLL